MKRLLMSLIFGTMLLTAQPYGAPRPGNSYGPTYGVRNNFAERISRGQRMGLITPREANRLWNMERDLRIATDRAYRNGYGISPRERDRLAQMSARLDYEISRQTRDGERNYRGGPGRW